MGVADAALQKWAHDQKALAKTLGLSISEWLDQLDRASVQKTGLTAAVVGAAVASGLGLSVLDQLDGDALAQSARALIDPEPPRVHDPVLAEAIRRNEQYAEGKGAARLKRRIKKPEPIPTPQRSVRPLGESAAEATPDAPGKDDE